MGFGTSKQQSQQQSQASGVSSSSNQAYPFLSNSLGGQVGNVGRGTGAIADLLGLNGSDAQTSGFDNFRNSSGYNFIRDEGIRSINQNNASKGLLNSGSALKAITNYSSNLANSFLDKYLSSLTGLSNTGLQAGQIISSAGNVSNSSSNSSSSGTSTGKSMNFNFG